MQSLTKNGQYFLYLSLIVILGSIFLRFYGISAPPFDTHNGRQVQTLSTADDYYENGIDLLHSKVHYQGYPGYQLLEFPLYQGIIAFLWKTFSKSIVVVRLFNISVNLLTAWLIILIVKMYFSKKLAFLTGVIYLMTPLNMVYSRSTLFEVFAVLLNVLVIYLYLKLGNISNFKSIFLFLIWSVTVILSAVVKPLYLAPFCVIFFFTFFKKDKRTIILYGISLSIALACLFLWLRHAKAVNSMYFFTYNFAVEDHLGFKYFFTFTYWAKMMQRFVLKITPGPLILFFLLSLVFFFLKDASLNIGPVIVTWTCIGVYLFSFANINRPHDYYQLILTPLTSFLAAFTFNYIYKKIDAAKIRNMVLFIFILSVFASSALTYFTYVRLSVPLIEFEERVKPHVNPENKFAFLFINATRYEKDPYYPKFRYYKAEDFEYIAALYSIDKWGRAFVDTGIEGSIEYIKGVPEDLLKHFGEIIYYRFHHDDFNEDYFRSLKKLGYEKSYSDNYMYIFQRAG